MAGLTRDQITHCRLRKHPFDEVNTGWNRDGSRYCRACRREAERRRARARRLERERLARRLAAVAIPAPPHLSAEALGRPAPTPSREFERLTELGIATAYARVLAFHAPRHRRIRRG